MRQASDRAAFHKSDLAGLDCEPLRPMSPGGGTVPGSLSFSGTGDWGDTETRGHGTQRAKRMAQSARRKGHSTKSREQLAP